MKKIYASGSGGGGSFNQDSVLKYAWGKTGNAGTTIIMDFGRRY